MEVFEPPVERCPYCESVWITGAEAESIPGENELVILRDCQCQACKRQWREMSRVSLDL
jgi:predicted Zn-ribbon and HTH transcriptional regulator